MSRLLERIRSRRMGEWALAYVVGGAMTYEVLSEVSQNFAWHPVVMQVVTVVLAMGLPAVLVVSWFHGEKGRQRVPLAEVVILASLVVVAGGWAVLVVRWEDRRAVELPPPPSTPAAPSEEPLSALIPDSAAPGVVVLPLEVIGGSEEDRQMAEGLHEELINRLTTSGEVSVITRHSVLSMWARGVDPSEVADSFGVRYSVTGTLRRADDELRVSIQLADSRQRVNLWPGTYDVDPSRPLAVQEDVAQAVAEVVVRRLAGGELPESELAPLNPAAHRAFLDGQHWIGLRTREGLAQAIQAFSRAVEVDPSYARAYAALSNALVLWVTYDYRGLDHFDAYSWALSLSDRAIELRPGMADAHLARGFLLSKAWAPAEQAEADFEVAVQRRPGSADVLGWYAFFLAREQRHSEALRAADRAIELDPYTPGRYVGFIFDALNARRPDLALREIEAVVRLAPELPLPRAQKAFALLLLDRAEECLGLDLSGHGALRAMCLHSVGRADEGAEIVAELVAAAGQGSNPPYIEAYYAWVGDVDETLGWLERSYARSPNGPDFRIIQSGIFDTVRDSVALDDRLAEIRSAVWARVARGARRLDPADVSLKPLDLTASAESTEEVPRSVR